MAAVRYDRDGDAHYDVTSAFIKSMRGSDPDAALHWLARMLVAGEDPRFIARRIVIFASEDVGMADPQALLVATAAAQAVQQVGLPEAQLNLAQAVVHLATAPKSNSVTTALGAAMADVRAGRGGCGPGPSARRALFRRAWSWSRSRLPLPARRPARRGHPAVRSGRPGRRRLLRADRTRRRTRSPRAGSAAAPDRARPGRRPPARPRRQRPPGPLRPRKPTARRVVLRPLMRQRSSS